MEKDGGNILRITIGSGATTAIFIFIYTYWFVEICISQEKPVILQDACPGRLLMDTYGNRK